MKRRIIGSILVVVMLVLSLASCAYSLANDKTLADYAPFTAEDKALLDKAIAAIYIEDGDFTDDPETRAKKVLEAINDQYVSAAKDNEKNKEGKPNAALDLVYYCYYAKIVDKDGNAFFAYTASMKDSAVKNLQLGREEYDTDLEKGVAEALKDYSFEDVYSSITTSTVTGEDGKSKDAIVKAGDLIFVNFKTTHTGSDGNAVTVTYENHPIIVKEPATKDAPASIEEFFCGKQIAKSFEDEPTYKVDGVDTKYTGLKISFAADGKMGTEFTVDLEKDLTVTTTTGSKTFKSADGVKVTYSVYPTYFVEVEEFNATTLLNLIIGADINYNYAIAILKGTDYVGLSEEEEEDKTKLDELNAWLETLKPKDADGKDVTFEEFINKLSTLQADLDDAKTALDKAQEEFDKKQTARDEAKATVDEAGDNATDKQKNDLASAEESYKTAEKSLNDAKTAHEKALKARDEKITALFALTEGMEDQIVKGYKIYTYDSLQSEYNNEIRQKLAKEIYFFINKYVTLTEARVPEKAIQLTYNQLMENYEHDFYTGDYTEDQSNYNYYLDKGMFKGYLQAQLKANSYDEACKLIREEAIKINEPLVRIYRLAAVYGDGSLLVDDKAFEDYKKNDEESYYYTYYEDTYGENSVRHAYQFDKLMNFWLEVVEGDGSDDVLDEKNGYVMKAPKFKGITEYFIGEPESSKTETESK